MFCVLPQLSRACCARFTRNLPGARFRAWATLWPEPVMPAKAAVCALLLAVGLAAQPRDHPRSSGLDLAGLDPTVRPQDDLFRFVNGGWLARTPVPGDRVTFGTFAELSDRIEADIRQIVEDTMAAPD